VKGKCRPCPGGKKKGRIKKEGDNKMEKEDINAGRRRVENELRSLVGSIFVPEAKLFAMRCGCYGFYADIRGLRADDVEAFSEKIKEIMRRIGEDMGLRADFIYARKLPGSEEVVALTARELCDSCRRELASSKSSPRPDIIVLKKRR